MRGVDPFPTLWARREEFELPGVGRVAVLSLLDLVKAKKTRRDKDWPMLRRLIEADVARARWSRVPRARLRFWLHEGRSYELLRELSQRHPELARRVPRAALRAAMEGDADRTAGLLRAEEDHERQQDRLYWAPLRSELERWRRDRPRQGR
jgi:hypothetical protein